jgi:hypothetical protein
MKKPTHLEEKTNGKRAASAPNLTELAKVAKDFFYYDTHPTFEPIESPDKMLRWKMIKPSGKIFDGFAVKQGKRFYLMYNWDWSKYDY